MLILLMPFWIASSSPCRNLTWSLLGDVMLGGGEFLGGVPQKVRGRFSLIACWTWSADASRLFSIVGTLRAVCETEGTPSSPVAILLIESRIFLVALVEPSPPTASLAFEILASALLPVSSSALSVSLVLPDPALCCILIIFVVFGKLHVESGYFFLLSFDIGMARELVSISTAAE